MESHQKRKKSGKGCLILIIVGICLAVAVVVGGAAAMMFYMRAAKLEQDDYLAHAEGAIEASMNAADEKGTVMLTAAMLEELSIPDFGAELSREQFVAAMSDGDATELVRQRFTEKANGQQVNWLLKVGDVSAPDSSGKITANCSLPYMIVQTQNWRHGSSINLQVHFAPEALDELMKIRRGQWVNVAGELRLENRGSEIHSARLGAE